MEYKKKELKIVEQRDLKGMCWHALPLSIILSNEHNLPWFYENFINISCMHYHDNNFDIEYCGNSMYKGKDYDVVKMTDLDFDNSSHQNDIIEFVKRNIDNDYYLYLYLDEYYLSVSPAYNKDHYIHNCIIYGYNDETRELNAIVMTENWAFEKRIFIYDEVEKAFDGRLKALEHPTQYPISLMQLRYTHRPYPFSLSRFVEQIGNYLGATVEEAQKFYMEHCGFYDLDNMAFGIGVYDIVIKALHNILSGQVVDVRARMNILLEHKKIILMRLRYVNEHFSLKSAFAELIKRYESLIEQFQMMLSLAIKFETVFYSAGYEHKSCINSVESIIKYLTQIKNAESEILLEIYHELRADSFNNIPRVCQTSALKDAERIVYDNKTIKYQWTNTIKLDRIRIVCTSVNVAHSVFIVELSNGGKYYTTGVVQNNIAADIRFYTADIEWVRIKSHSGGFDDIQIEIYEASMALNMPAFASSSNEDICTPDKAFNSEGELNNWHAVIGQGNDEFIGVDLEEEKEFNTVTIKQNKWLNSIHGFIVQVSHDGKSWIDVYAHENEPIGNRTKVCVFNTVAARQMRILFTDVRPDDNNWIGLSLDSIEVHICE